MQGFDLRINIFLRHRFCGCLIDRRDHLIRGFQNVFHRLPAGGLELRLGVSVRLLRKEAQGIQIQRQDRQKFEGIDRFLQIGAGVCDGGLAEGFKICLERFGFVQGGRQVRK